MFHQYVHQSSALVVSTEFGHLESWPTVTKCTSLNHRHRTHSSDGSRPLLQELEADVATDETPLRVNIPLHLIIVQNAVNNPSLDAVWGKQRKQQNSKKILPRDLMLWLS